jgi:hypothetical protein
VPKIRASWVHIGSLQQKLGSNGGYDRVLAEPPTRCKKDAFQQRDFFLHVDQAGKAASDRGLARTMRLAHEDCVQEWKRKRMEKGGRPPPPISHSAKPPVAW